MQSSIGLKKFIISNRRHKRQNNSIVVNIYVLLLAVTYLRMNKEL
jgi:hypothetical protein